MYQLSWCILLVFSASCYPLFSLFHRDLKSLTLSIYLYSHLFTFLFKIFVYKCVYKLKLISSYPVSKWHLQGKGCVGLRFLIALQEPTKGSTEHCLNVWDWFKLIREVSLSCEPHHTCVSFYIRDSDSVLVPKWWSEEEYCLYELRCHTKMH